MRTGPPAPGTRAAKKVDSAEVKKSGRLLGALPLRPEEGKEQHGKTWAETSNDKGPKAEKSLEEAF